MYTLDSPEPLRNGFVEYDEQGRILHTGLSPDISKESAYYHGAIVPGFVNSHCHIELSDLRGMFRKGSGMAGFIDQINSMRDTKSVQEKIAEIDRWMKLLWDRGVNAMADISNCDNSFAIKAKSPMYTRTFLEVFGTEDADCDSVMSAVQVLSEKAASLGLDAAPTPHSCYTMSPRLLSSASAAGLQSGYLSYHCEESPEEDEMIRCGSGKMYDNRIAAGMSVPPVTGKSSAEYFMDRLSDAVPLPVEGHVLLVHEVCMTQEGIDAVKRAVKHPFIALCPLSNIFIHNALPPVELMRANGLKLTVGTDSLSSNDDLDMVSELFCLQENFPDIAPSELLGWACLNGAEFLSKEDELGSISVGKRPGLVLVDHLSPDGRLTVSSTSHRII